MGSQNQGKCERIQALVDAYGGTEKKPTILWDCSQEEIVPDGLMKTCPPNKSDYDKKRGVFNTKFEFFPLAIILCSTDDHVRVGIEQARLQGIGLRARSGGHDHEGESSGDDILLLDLSLMNHVQVDHGSGIATIGPGIRFEQLTKKLADRNVMIPHGTCASVCIGGFSMGGGWGPWTRAYGMCCERIIGARMVLANGAIIEARVDGNDSEKALLWALKGGGGFSYGIVTELRIQTFELPAEMYRFSITWNNNPNYPEDLTTATLPEENNEPVQELIPTLQILSAWEQTILDTSSPEANQLLGTNLKIYARPPHPYESFDPDRIAHGCVMYGYWEGSRENLLTFINTIAERSGAQPGQFIFKIGEPAGRDHGYPHESLMNDWDRTSTHEYRTLNQSRRALARNFLANAAGDTLGAEPFKPDVEGKQAHQITSRLVNPGGLGRAGHIKLIESLTSRDIHEENLISKLYTYATLGAITGDFYQNRITEQEKEQSAFPYKEHLYTIQYQTWWGQSDDHGNSISNDHTRQYLNRALDWMQSCRDFDIPNTSGAFISFKDSSIATRTYFDKNYERLVEIKETHSQDPDNLFQTRKTIT